MTKRHQYSVEPKTRCLGWFILLFLSLSLPISAAGEEHRLMVDIKHGDSLGEWSPNDNTEQPALSINEPMYFIVGRDGGVTTGRLQFSFKYRILDADGWTVKNAPWMEKLHFGYTQTLLWNLSADSVPFEDSSYRPSFFWQVRKNHSGVFPDFLRGGYEHESNGQAGEDSRSMDTLFIVTAWETKLWGRDFSLAPKFYLYLSKGKENEDIEDFRGYTDLHLRYGNVGEWLIAAMWRHGEENKDALQLDLSYPMRKRFFARAGGFFYLQTFYGYGESLKSYNQKQDLQVRVGFAIVR